MATVAMAIVLLGTPWPLVALAIARSYYGLVWRKYDIKVPQ